MSLALPPSIEESPASGTTVPTRDQLPASEWSLVDWYLEQQGQLTAVEQFSRVHNQLSMPVYRTLLPAKPPGPGEQYAFEVDLDRCSGCKACVTACHSLNGLDDNETWRDVGLLTGGHDQLPFQQHVTTACHHCLEPACMQVCPTLAYEKDAATGIVRHLDDQCFGCQYCILACPYNVPKYNARLGIVRKCDLCSQRLAVGEAPACVQACPHEAIRIHVVNVEQVKADAETSQFLPGTPDPQYTLPTTNYKTERPLPRNLLPADYFRVQTEHAHGPLVAMLVLTQMSVGGFFIAALLSSWNGIAVSDSVRAIQFSISLAVCYVALTASLLHLGRPWLAYRAVLGLKSSWLSREILAFGLFAAAASWLTVQSLFPKYVPTAGLTPSTLLNVTAVTGLIGVFCSAMIYHRTKRPFWNVYQSGTRFLLTVILLGLAVTSVACVLAPDVDRMRGQLPSHETIDSGWHVPESSTAVAMGQRPRPSQSLKNVPPHIDYASLLSGILIVSLLKGLLELGALAPLLNRQQTPLKRSALLLVGPLRASFLLRFGLLAVSGIVITGVSMLNLRSEPGTAAELIAAVSCLVGLAWGELIERSLFFKASVAFRMPGGPAA